MGWAIRIIACVLAASLVRPAHGQPPSRLATIADSIVRTQHARSRIPGIGFVLADRNGTLLAKGYGMRREGGAEAVDERTQFSIASLTKTVTATAVALLAEEGRLAWSDPVQKQIPWFSTDQPYVTERATLRDLAAMRVGWPSGDSLVFAIQTDEALRAHVRARPVGSFRAAHGQASNLSYALLGRALEGASGQSWFEVVNRRLLSPLGMTRTFPERARAVATGNLAEGHAADSAGVRVVPTVELTPPLRPAAGLYSSATDLGPWIQFQLGGRSDLAAAGIVDSALRQIQVPRILIERGYESMFRIPSTTSAYGHGWFVYDYRGQRVLEHWGLWGGYASALVIVPERSVGFAVLANLRTGGALNDLRTLRMDLIDALMR